MQIKDAPSGYGWLSIALHWLNAVAVVMLWFIGNKMTGPNIESAEAAELLRVHTSVAITVYALLWLRIIWRFRSGHPQGLPDQGRIAFTIARTVHYSLLVTIAVMLVSGPLQVFFAGERIGFYNLLDIESPFTANEGLHAFFATAHRWGGNVLFVTALVHMSAAAKQILFGRGETARRMTSPTGER
jgi:cytochrome b561